VLVNNSKNSEKQTILLLLLLFIFIFIALLFAFIHLLRILSLLSRPCTIVFFYIYKFASGVKISAVRPACTVGHP
jgi:hypothetical protein